MRKTKLLLLALVLTAIPNFIWAYTKDQIVSFDNEQTHYQVIQPDGETGKDPTVRFISTKKAGHFEIPSTVSKGDGVTFTVVEVGSISGYTSTNLTSVTLPSTIKVIGINSFSGATKLESINIPANVETINPIAFGDLRTVPVFTVDPANSHFSSDANGVLYSKDKKTLYNVPTAIAEKINSNTYTVDPAVTKINRGAFPAHAKLTKVILPEGLETVEQVYPPIATTNTLKEFEIASGNPTFKVDGGVLFDKTKKELVCYPRAKADTDYKVPDEFTSIGQYGIMNTDNITSLDLNKVEKTTSNSVYGAKNLQTITIPTGLKKDGLKEGAFVACDKINEYKVADDNPDFVAVDGVVFSKVKDKLFFYPPSKAGATYTIPETVKEIAAQSFQAASNLTSITIPKGVEKVGTAAFRNMSNLETVTFEKPSSTTTLEQAAFRGCEKLKTVTLPATITELNDVFNGCKELETVTMPADSKLKTIKPNVFTTNKKLKTFKFEGNCDLETIEENAFANAESLESFNMPKSVRNIKRNAFTGCKKLATVTFDPEAVIAEIGEGAFADCGLQGISIPKNVTKIAKEAFRKCKDLKKIEVTKATTDIDPLAFQYCENLTDINVEKENTKYSSVDGYLLSHDKKELILFPPGKANSKFTLLPPSIETIGENSFFNCEKLTNVTIPNKVKSIGKRAFGLCKNLKVITFLCDDMIPAANINTAKNEMSFDDGTQTAGQSMFDHITINVRKELATNYNGEAFYKKFKGGIKESFTIGDEEYIAMSEESVNMLSTTRKDHTFVLPTSIKHNNKDYKVSLIGDYAFQKVTTDVKEVVVKKDVEYIGAEAFITADKTQPILNIFFIEGNPTKQMLSTTRFELDETGNNYNEFAKKTKIYVKKSALETYKKEWNKQVYDLTAHAYKTSEFNFIDQLDYKIPGVSIKNKYGTFAREFDTDFSIYKQENNNKGVIAAFVAKDGDIRMGNGDYGTSAYNVQMRSIDEKGGVSDNYGYVPAYTGVLLKVLDNKATPEDFYYAIGEKDDQTYTINNNIMHGITVNSKSVSASAADPIYVIQGGIFRKVTNSIASFTIHKAYAKIPGVPANAPVTFSFSDDDTTTGVMTIDAEKPIDNTYYNLNGQRVTNPQRGIYIQGGRKVIIK
ncbi:leucine-rich repeat protein [Alloprevotella tannerae]|uniref:leucine-rich repeat domain-containing protein n=1 Tax=Alloprevotella tannerae TaxID=76122 RepID=UPI001EDA3F11|nr:leucine-rich repeat domain-containing protein [Alloprevotella tannerae]MCG2647743.1 leucine-rich repeat protein [Alloprevotella tannerae]